MSKNVRIGLVGCGRAAERLYVPSLPKVTGGRVVAVSDPREDRRTMVARAFGDCQPFESLEAMLDGAELDAVIVATPPATHVAVAKQALDRGAWVLVEKPLAETLADAQTLLHTGGNGAAAKRVMVGYNRRQWGPMAELSRIMRQRDKSQPVKVDAVFSIDASGWGALTGTVDPIDDLASHYLDLLRFVFGEEFQTVSAHWPQKNTVKLRLTMTGNVQATLEHAHTDHTTEYMTVEAGGRRYAVRMGSSRITPADGPVRKAADLADKVCRKLTGGGWTLGESYARQFERFFRCVRDGVAPEPGVADGIAVIRATEAARASAARDGAEVSVDGQ